MKSETLFEQPIADDKERAWPGDLSKGEIRIVKPATFDEDGPHVQLLEDEVEFPNGTRDKLVRATRTPHAEDGVVIAPVTEADELVVVRQFRHAPRLWTWELPRGGTEVGQTPGSAVHAELLQEIGYQPADAPFSLGRVMPDSGTLYEIPYLYAVRVRPHPAKSASPDPNEQIAGHRCIAYEELWQLCLTGAINDALTMAAVLRLRPHFTNGRFEINRRYVHKYSRFEYQTPKCLAE
jgi:ADP-ribose pyrophosphatase